MSLVEVEIANKVEDALAALPIGAPPAARMALIEARAALLRAAESLADASEAPRSH